MRKTISFGAIVASLFLVSCQKDEFINPVKDGSSPIFTATIADSSTKTSVDALTGKVSWETTDTIVVRDAASKTAVYKIQSIDEGGKATFVIKEGQTALGVGPYTATYGAKPSTSQSYSATAGRLYMEAGSTSSTNFTFSVKCGLMRINLTKEGESVSRIRVSGTPEGGVETTYTLMCETAQSIASAKDFCIALPAGSYNRIQVINDKHSICNLNAASGVSVSINRIRPVTIADSKISFSAATGLCFEAKVAGSKVGMTNLNLAGAPELQKSTDGINWDEGNWDGSEITLANVGDRAYFRAASGGNSGFVLDPDESIFCMFTTSGDLKLSGNIMYLLNSTPAQTMTEANILCFMYLFAQSFITDASDLLLPSSVAPICYNGMFYGSHLTQAPDLPAMELASYCYASMFEDCTGLENAPALPATKLDESCYSSMFKGCTGLKNAPALPATELAADCYSSIFEGCTGLENAPALPATELAEECYYSMFKGCISLENAPALPATELAGECYYSMFLDCFGLKNAPELPATKLAQQCYYSMFKSCKLLEAAPTLPATELAPACYRSMFEGCIALASVQDSLKAGSLKDNCYNTMFKDCISLTEAPVLCADSLGQYSCASMFCNCIKLTFVPDFTMKEVIGYGCCSSMFDGCLALKYAPALPATTLGEACYRSMFKSCGELETAPTLGATVLVGKCYQDMFYSCAKLSSVTMLATDISCPDDPLSNWLYESGTDESVTGRKVFVAPGMVDAIKLKVPTSPDWRTGVQEVKK